MITAFLIATLVVFSLNLLLSLYAFAINVQEKTVNYYGIVMIMLPLIMVSWNIYCLIEY